MSYILKNIMRFLKNERLIFCVIVICVLCSSLILNFSYGLYQNYNVKKTESEIELNTIFPTIAEGCTLTKRDLQNYSMALTQETLDAMEVICGMAELDNFKAEDYGELYMRFTIRDGRFQICEHTKESFERQGQLLTGRYITNEEEANGAYVALNSIEMGDTLSDGEGKIRLFGNDYTVIGTYKGASSLPIVPFLTIPDSLQLTGVGIMFYHNVTKAQYNELTSVAEDILPGKLVFDDLQFPDSDTVYLYNNIMLIAILISLVSAINFTMLYLYMVKKRSHELSVFRICGCTKSKAVHYYLGECILISVPTYFAGIGLYIILLKQVLSGAFEFMEQAYNWKIYLSIFLIYLTVVLLLMEIVIRNKVSSSVMDSLRGGRN